MTKLLEILSALHPEIDFRAPHRLIDERILDSIDIVTLVGDINDSYDVNLPIEEITPENFNSVDAIYDMIRRLRG